MSLSTRYHGTCASYKNKSVKFEKTGIEWQDLQVTNSAFRLAIVAMLTDRAQEQRMHLCMFFVLISLVPRPWRRKGLVHIARACAGVSIATDRVTIVIARGFCMTYSSTGDKRRVYDSIRLPHIFLGSPGACACNVYQALSPPPLEGSGNVIIIVSLL